MRGLLAFRCLSRSAWQRLTSAAAGRIAQLGERQLDKLEVTGSSPVAPIRPCPHGKRDSGRFRAGRRSNFVPFRPIRERGRKRLESSRRPLPAVILVQREPPERGYAPIAFRLHGKAWLGAGRAGQGVSLGPFL
jgi:hypothetical protein